MAGAKCMMQACAYQRAPDGLEKTALACDCRSEKKLEHNQVANENDTPKRKWRVCGVADDKKG